MRKGFTRNMYDADPKTCNHFFTAMKSNKKKEICIYCKTQRDKPGKPGSVVTKGK